MMQLNDNRNFSGLIWRSWSGPEPKITSE